MTPTLVGRIQTRILLLGTVGLAWTVVVVPFLPRFGAAIGDVYNATLTALVLVAVFGFGFESLYHLLQQYRWEKDWPIIYGLVAGVPESIVTFVALGFLPSPAPSATTFFLHFGSMWLVVWLSAIGPMRVAVLRWRFSGGRVL